MNIYDLISRAQKLRKETQLDSVSPDRVGGLQEDTLKYINEFQLLASSPSLHKIYASVSAMQSDKSPKSDLTGRALKPGQLVVIVPADQSDATAGDVYRYDGPSGNTSAWTFVAKIGAVPADAELSATSANPVQNKVVTEKLTELESETEKIKGIHRYALNGDITQTTKILEGVSLLPNKDYVVSASFMASIPVVLSAKIDGVVVAEVLMVEGDNILNVSKGGVNVEIYITPQGGLVRNIDLVVFAEGNQLMVADVIDIKEKTSRMLPLVAKSSVDAGFVKECYIWGNGVSDTSVYSIPTINKNYNGLWQIYFAKDGVNVGKYESSAEDKSIISFGGINNVYIMLFIDWELLAEGVNRANAILTNAILDVTNSPTIGNYINRKQNDIVDLGKSLSNRVFLKGDFSEFSGGYWNSDRSMTSYPSYRAGKINISEFVGKVLHLVAGYTNHWAAHCYLEINGELTDITSLDSYKINNYEASCVISTDASWLYYSYSEGFEVSVSDIEYYNNTSELILNTNECFSELGESRFFEIQNNTNYIFVFKIQAYISDIALKGIFDQVKIEPKSSLVIELPYVIPTLEYYKILPTYSNANYNVIVHEKNPIKYSWKSATIPKIGCGSLVVSKDVERHALAPQILNLQNSLYVFYQSGWYHTTEYPDGNNLMMMHYDKLSNNKTHKLIEQDLLMRNEVDGNAISKTYNHSIAYDGTFIILRYCCHVNNEVVMVCRKIRANSTDVSELQMQKLKYNNTEYDWTFQNYLKMLNEVYGNNYDDSLTERYTLEINGITKYNGKYYTALCQPTVSGSAATAPTSLVLMVSDDAIVWSPIAELSKNVVSSETEISINNGIVLIAMRSQSFGTYYVVCDINGKVLKERELISHIDSKPFTFVYRGETYIMYNIPRKGVEYGTEAWDSFYSKYFGRVKVCIAKLNADYSLTEIQSYYSPNGWCYYTASVFGDQIIVVNTQDSRGNNIGKSAGCTGEITLQELIIE